MTPRSPDPDAPRSTATDERSGAVIPTCDRPACPGCGGAGEVVYDDLNDLLFGAPGRWSMRECRGRECGMLWLDPAPRPDLLHRLYEHYYTHEDPSAPNSTARSFYARVVDAHVARRFGYTASRPDAAARLLAWLLPLFPGRRSLAETGVADLRFRPSGRLLEVGCGSGTMLARLRDLGWDVQGVDFDPAAVKNARRKGLDVRQGGLEAGAYADGTFDAVIASHVIEHLPEPPAFLAAARRILRPGGRLVVDTPNARSHGRRRFGRHWRGLEPPRHLLLFTPRSLVRMAQAAGFAPVRWKPVECGGVLLLHSRMLRDQGRIDPRRNLWIRLAHDAADLAEWARTRLAPESAEVIRMTAEAP